MGEAREQIADAIRRGLYLGKERSRGPFGGMGWDKLRELTVAGVVVRDADCEPARTQRTVTEEEWIDRVDKYGLWTKVGMWDFVLADDEAAGTIRFCNQYPDAAGRELFRLRKLVQDFLSF